MNNKYQKLLMSNEKMTAWKLAVFDRLVINLKGDKRRDWNHIFWGTRLSCAKVDDTSWYKHGFAFVVIDVCLVRFFKKSSIVFM